VADDDADDDALDDDDSVRANDEDTRQLDVSDDEEYQ
jgi:hypothetical protein